MLHPPAAIEPDLALVIGPLNAEGDDAVGLRQPPQDAGGRVLRIGLLNRDDVPHDFFDGLEIFLLARVPGGDLGHQFARQRGRAVGHGRPF